MPTQVFIKVIPGFNHQSSVCQVAPNSKPQQGQVLVGSDNNALLCLDLESKITTVDPIAFPIIEKPLMILFGSTVPVMVCWTYP